jgi:hypothetical protein
LSALNLNLIARLLDSDVFVRAAETSTGIFEMEPGFAAAESRQFQPIADWVRGEQARREAAAANVFQLGRNRFG